MALMRNALLWASRNRWLAQRFPRYRFAQAAVRRFMPGTTSEAALDAAQSFVPHNIGTLVTHLGENLTDLHAADHVVEHYRTLLDMIAERNTPTQLSIKLTQLGLDISEQAAHDHFESLATHAAAKGNVVWIDMEDSTYVDRTLALFESALERHKNIGLCVQSYLYRTERDLDRLLQKTVAIRLVKGAYNEPREVAFPQKDDVDANYFKLGRLMLAATQHVPNGPRPAFGTHDLGLLANLANAAQTDGTGLNSFEIQMLYGIQPSDQKRLAAEGHQIRVLISYGEEWFPWYVRRLAERPANIWFVVRNMFR